MNVLAGPDNAVTQEMTAFMNNSTGTTTVAGMNLSNQQLAAIGAGQNDVSITIIFPKQPNTKYFLDYYTK